MRKTDLLNEIKTRYANQKRLNFERQVADLVNDVFDRYAKEGELLSEHAIRMVHYHIWKLCRQGNFEEAENFSQHGELDLSKMQEVVA